MRHLDVKKIKTRYSVIYVAGCRKGLAKHMVPNATSPVRFMNDKLVHIQPPNFVALAVVAASLIQREQPHWESDLNATICRLAHMQQKRIVTSDRAFQIVCLFECIWNEQGAKCQIYFIMVHKYVLYFATLEKNSLVLTSFVGQNLSLL